MAVAVLVEAEPPGIGEAMRAVITPRERELLAQAIARVEQTTAGEIVAVVLRRSAHYGAYRVAFSATIALLAVTIAQLCFPRVNAVELLGAQFLLAILVGWLSGWPLLLRRIVPSSEQQRAVNERAKVLFIELGVTETLERSGVLILLSAFERRVEILGDRGIHEHLGQDAWRAIVMKLTSAIASGKAFEGLSAIIEQLGTSLSERFPARSADTNELSNQVVTD